MGNHDLPAHFFERDPASGRKRVTRRRQQHDVVDAERHGVDAAVGGLKGEHAEIDGSVEERLGDLARGHPTDFDRHARVGTREPFDVRKQRVDGRFVRAHDHPSPADLLELPDRQLGLACQPQQALRIVLEQASGLGQGPVPRGPVEEPFAKLILDPPNGLADSRLGPVEPPGGRRKAAIGGNGEECGQILAAA